MEQIFYYNYKKQAIKPLLLAIGVAVGGAAGHLLFNWIKPNLTIIAYFFYIVSFWLLFSSLWLALRPNKKYLVLTDSSLRIISEKDCIEIPRSQIFSAELCQSPIEFKAQPRIYGHLYLRDTSQVLKLSLKSPYIKEVIDINYYNSDIENNFGGSEFVYIELVWQNRTVT